MKIINLKSSHNLPFKILSFRINSKAFSIYNWSYSGNCFEIRKHNTLYTEINIPQTDRTKITKLIRRLSR